MADSGTAPLTSAVRRVPPVPTPRISLASKKQGGQSLSNLPRTVESDNEDQLPLGVEIPSESRLYSSAEDDSSTTSVADSIHIHCAQMSMSDSTSSSINNEGDEMAGEEKVKERERSFSHSRAVPLANPGQTVHEYLCSPLPESFSAQGQPDGSLSSRLSGSDFAVAPRRAQTLSLLEQLVRTHPIWFLQDIDRPTAEILLRPQRPGTFIVRGSSRSQSVALSVRVGLAGLETEHLLIVQAGPAGGVRLHSSPHVFRSLPLLIAHYCTYLQELRLVLRLPVAVVECNSSASLQGIALMGRDFWSSDLAMRGREGGFFSIRSALPPSASAFSCLSCSGDSAVESVCTCGPSFYPPNLYPPNLYPAPTASPAHNETRQVWENRDRAITSSGSSSTLDHRESPVPFASLPRSGSARGKGPSGLFKALVDGKAAQLAQCALFLPFRSKPAITSHSSADVTRSSSLRGLPSASRVALVPPTSFRSSPLPSSPSSSTFNPSSFFNRSFQSGDKREQGMGEGGRAAGEGTPRPPPPPPTPFALLPPSDALDPGSIKKCVDELRRKRLQSTEELLGSGERTNEQDLANRTVLRPKRMNAAWMEAGPEGGQPGEDTRPSPRDSLRNHRLSAPSLPASSADVQAASAVFQSARAIKHRIPPHGDDGELTTINEGLVTPVVRRRAPEGLSGYEYEEKQEDGENFFPPPTSTSTHFTNDVAKRESASRRGHCSVKEKTTPTGTLSPSALTSPPAASPTSPSPSAGSNSFQQTVLRTPNSAGWSAVNSEFARRQHRIAKVLPTRHPRVPVIMTAKEKESAKEQEGAAGDSQAPLPGQPRLSEYAHLSDYSDSATPGSPFNHDDDCVSVAATVFDEPWDSRMWEKLLVCAGEGDSRLVEELEEEAEEEVQRTDDDCNLTPLRLSSRVGSRSSLLSAHLGLTASLRRPAPVDSATATIQDYVAFLATTSGTFAKSLDRFFVCTKESTEKDPRVVMKNVRQFMNGLKNYLVKQGEADLHPLIERESSRLDSNRCLNIDACLEAVLSRLLLKPLYTHIRRVVEEEEREIGSRDTLSRGVERTRHLSPSQIGLPSQAVYPSEEQWEWLKKMCQRMQRQFSPQHKLELLLRVIQGVMELQPTLAGTGGGPSMGCENDDPAKQPQRPATPPPADELIRWLVLLISRTLGVDCDCETLYMNELLPSQVRQSGSVAFYLTAFDSAIRILSSPDALHHLMTTKCSGNEKMSLSHLASSHFSSASDCLVRVAVPDEEVGCVHYESFPLVAEMQAGQLCRLVAHQHSITNPQDYGLYVLADGFETALPSSQSIHEVRQQVAAKPFFFAYKRHEARIAWPRLRR